MERITLDGAPEVTVLLRRSARARRLSLRVSQLDGRVTLTMPARARLREAVAFAREKEGWIRGNLSGLAAEIRPVIGTRMLWKGQEIALLGGTGRAARMGAQGLLVPPDARTQTRRILAFVKHAARAELAQASDHFAAALGCHYGTLSLRDTRSRWGSCSSAGNLMYSWRLIMAPPIVLRYVAAHEVAHLLEMNHSPAFWRVVGRVFPDHRAPRAWLRQNGALLHRYRFLD